MTSLLPNQTVGHGHRELQRQPRRDNLPCHVGTMSRKPAKGEYIETVSSLSSRPIPLIAVQNNAPTLSLLPIPSPQTRKKRLHHSSPQPLKTGHRQQSLATLADHWDYEHHPWREDSHPGRGHHPRRPPAHIPAVQPQREAGEPRRRRHRQVLLLQSRMRAETSREAV